MGLLQRLLGIREGGYSDTLWCHLEGNTYAPCDILEESDDGYTLVFRKTDGRKFWVGVRDDVRSVEYGWITIFWEDEAREVYS